MLGSLSAQAVEWTGETGDFLDANNWSDDVPETSDEALINNGGTAKIADDADVLTLRLDRNGGSGVFEQSSGFFTAGGAFIGDNSTGSARISNGTFEIGNDSIHVGWRPDGIGEMTIDGIEAFIKSGDDFQLGREGTRTLNFSAGELRAGYTVIGKYGTGILEPNGQPVRSRLWGH
ncbi:MAG: hypothetical protein P8N76_18790 [Pirellulaceae bacterium]|nr:hypothetical protein [Pirellulaceae bacterium]